ncbi:MAG: alpha-amylase family glycosyl hydrolase [Anaerolineales bacterium]
MKFKLSLAVALLLAGCVTASPTTPAPSPTPAAPSAAPATATVAPPSPTAAPPSATPAPTALAATAVGAIQGLPAGTDGYPWWNDSVFYEVFVRSFFDSGSASGGAADGIGDLNGLTAKLDYLQELGVTGLWLMPIQPSPSYHGYDPTDYFDVNPDYGTLEDFKRLVAEAHQRGIRVIIDFVLNHTSDQHPWFIASRDPQSPYRDWYIWSDSDPGYVGPWGEEVWHSTSAGDYYYGIFTGSQPDLNYRNPEVTAQMDEVARFWLEDMGIDGFRLDGAKHLIEDGQVQQNSDSTHAWYQAFREFYKGVKAEALTVGEMFGDPSSVVASYSQGDQLDLGFDFSLADTFLNGARTGRAGDVAQALDIDYRAFKPLQFATFLTNHDQNRVMSQLAGKVDKAKVAAALLLTAPGVPFIYYGEEIGMVGLKPDEQLRTPMQWSAEANAGFTSGQPWELPNPDYIKGRNVADETADPNSLLSTYRALVGARNQHAALRVGDQYLPTADQDTVFASLRVSQGEAVLVIINMGPAAVSGLHLTLAAGPLSGSYRAAPIVGGGPVADLAANSQGGFESYAPVEELPAYGTIIVQLQPAP